MLAVVKSITIPNIFHICICLCKCPETVKESDNICTIIIPVVLMCE